MGEAKLTHIDEKGAARMVDVAGKAVTKRRAVAESFVRMSPGTIAAATEGRNPKGDVFAVARVAGIMAAKKTSDLIPLCHPLPLTSVTVDLAAEDGGIRVTAAAETEAKTGVEMEAMTAASVAALAIYDMCKAAEKGMVVEEVKLLSKEGGKSGSWTRKED